MADTKCLFLSWKIISPVCHAHLWNVFQHSKENSIPPNLRMAMRYPPYQWIDVHVQGTSKCVLAIFIICDVNYKITFINLFKNSEYFSQIMTPVK